MLLYNLFGFFMKLSFKLLLAPLLTAVVILTTGYVDGFFIKAELAHTADQMKRNLVEYKSMAHVQIHLGDLHTDVYRIVALVSALDEARIAAERKGLQVKIENLKVETSKIETSDAALKNVRTAS